MVFETLLRQNYKALIAVVMTLGLPAGNLIAQGDAVGELGNASVIDAVFTSATSIPVFASSFTASGKSVSINLGFAPPVGTVLTLVRNTSLDLIGGNFVNLAQGEKVTLTYEGSAYTYVADYYGGSGNDLVLQPADTTCLSWDASPNGTTRSLNTGILEDKTITRVSATSHTLILCADGTLASLGNNDRGQLGIGFFGGSPTVPQPVDRSGVLKNKTVIAIATGWTFSVALCSDGTIATWGENFYSSLGNGTTTNSNVPVEVVRTGVLAGKQVIAIAAGYYHVLALCSDGTLVAWGRGANGQLGDGKSMNSTVPVLVNATGILRKRKVIAIGGGQIHSLALCSDGTLASWGDDDQYGQLGNGSVSGSSNTPTPVNQAGALAGKTVVSITCGSYFNFAHCSDDTLVSWGSNTQGQLGINRVGGFVTLPTLVDRTGAFAGKTISSVAAGYVHSLATCTDGSMLFWGGLSASIPAPVLSQESALSGGKAFIRAASSPSSGLSVGFLVETPPLPASITVSSGSGQTAATGTAFDFQLQALVRDSRGFPLGGVPVTFTAPTSGASARFGENATVTVATDSGGFANSGTMAANTANGTYTVTASYPGASSPARFTLGNGTPLPTVTLPAQPDDAFRLNRQSGLLELTATAINTTPLPINGFRLHIDLSPYLEDDPSLRLQNASSPPGEQPAYVDYPYPVPVNGTVSLTLSVYSGTRRMPDSFQPALRIEVLPASDVADANGGGVQPRTVAMVDGGVLIEFPSVPGRWYRVRYSGDMRLWRDCPVPIQATGTRVQWIDKGPPFTDIPPSDAPNRFYTVNEIAAP